MILGALWAVAYKETIQLKRSSFLIRRILLLQALNFVMLAWLDVTVRGMPTVVVDQDHTTESRILVDRIAATHTFAIKYLTGSVEQAREHIRAGRASVAIVVPPDYARRRAAGGSGPFVALVDGSDPVA